MVIVIIRTPWSISKGLDHPYLHVYACLLLCFMLVLASLVLGFAMLDAISEFMVVRLHPTPMRPCLDVTIWDASPWCRLLLAYISPFLHDMLVMLVCATRWLYMHLYMLAYMSMHESYFLVCRPCFNTMKLWTFNPNLHLSLADATFIYYLAGLPFACLFAILLVCLLACLLTSLFLCLPCLSHLSTLCLFHMLFAPFSFHCVSVGFLSLPLHVYTWSEDAWS